MLGEHEQQLTDRFGDHADPFVRIERLQDRILNLRDGLGDLKEETRSNVIEFDRLGDIIGDLILGCDRRDKKLIDSSRKEVLGLCEDFPIYQ